MTDMIYDHLYGSYLHFAKWEGQLAASRNWPLWAMRSIEILSLLSLLAVRLSWSSSSSEPEKGEHETDDVGGTSSRKKGKGGNGNDNAFWHYDSTFSMVEEDLEAVVMAYLPGEFGAQAIAQVLSGAYNPSGRLPFTWPREASRHVTYDRKGTENVDTDFEMTAFRPQYAFGHGLNYSEVKTTGIRLLNEGEVYLGDDLRVEVTLENVGMRTSAEVVMLFSQDRVASITPSEDKLRAYKRVFVDAGATKQVQLNVPTSELGFIGHDLDHVVEPGIFALRVADQLTEFELKK